MFERQSVQKKFIFFSNHSIDPVLYKFVNAAQFPVRNINSSRVVNIYSTTVSQKINRIPLYSSLIQSSNTQY